MKFFSLFLILAMSVSTYVVSGPVFADCRISHGRSFVLVGEGETVSLLSEGKSLANHKIQDQDGLGICYANATTAMLKTVLPGNPDVSYLHAAVQSSTNGNRGKFNPNDTQYWRMGQENKMESFTSGGFICETMNALKKTGGACRKEQSLLEMNNFPAAIQETVFKNLGIYFDALNNMKQGPAGFEKFKNDFILAIEAINNEKEAMRQSCEMQKSSDLPLEKAMTHFLNAQYFNLNDDSLCAKIRFEEFKKLIDPDSKFTNDRTRIKPSQETMTRLKNMISADSSLRKKLAGFVALPANRVNRLHEMDAAKVLGKKLYELYYATVPKKSSLPVCSDHKDNFMEDNLGHGDTFIRDIREAKSTICTVDLKAVFDDVFSHNKCIAPTNLEKILNAFSSLMEVGMDVNQVVLQNNLLNQNSTNARQLKDLLFPGCNRDENLFSLSNLSCATYTPCESNMNRFNDTYYNGPKGGCVDLSSAVTETRKLIHNGLVNNRALGVSVCTSFMVNPKLKTNYCKNKGPGVEKHAYHAMAVSALRCSDGKIEYQLLNSWGAFNCPEGARLPNSPLKCDTTVGGMPTGKFWVPEDIMVDGMIGLSEIKNGAQ